MKRILILTTAPLLLLLMFAGCPYGYKYHEGHFPSQPVNFSDVNSMYNDFNSDSPVISDEHYLCFSSDRISAGMDYDIVGDYLHILWDRDKGTLTIDDKPLLWKDYDYVDTLFARMNSEANEFGPYSLPYYFYQGLSSYYTDLMVYSNDQSGNLDLKMVCFEGRGENPSPDSGTFIGPVPVKFLNTEFDDCYLSFYGPQFVKYPYGAVPEEINEIIFCSNRSGDYNFYSVPVPLHSNIVDFLQADTILPVSPVEILNSANDDKCPYVDGDLMVFSSDRSGGVGGFDLWYSRRTDAGWSEPVNFGDRINTQYNEYRPIVMLFYEFAEDLMLFSSDRPDGKGGYDLYYVGISKMIE
jgi:hypothetical protein